MSRLLIFLLCCYSVSAAQFPLKIDAGAHYLVDQSGAPFWIQGDSPWFIIQRLNNADADYYLSNRWIQGYNSIILDLHSHRYGTNGVTGGESQFDIYGHLPFTNTIAGPYTNFLATDERYYTNADWVIQRAAYYGLNVFLYPMYDGFNGGSVGWYRDMAGNGSNVLWQFGKFIGNRYLNQSNIVYVGSGDYNEPGQPNVLWNAVALGIQSVDSNHIFTAQSAFGTAPISYYSNFTTLNNTYGSGDTLDYQTSLANYQRSPISPSFLRESGYEHSVTALACRQEAWGAILSGDAGQCFGSDWQWYFTNGWQGLIWSDQGGSGITNILKVVNGRPWWNWVPDTNNSVATSGRGTSGNNNYCTVTRDINGSGIVAYYPAGNALNVTFDMSKLKGPNVASSWFNPRTGATTIISTNANTGTQSFSPSDGNDWVLLLDNQAVTSEIVIGSGTIRIGNGTLRFGQ